MSEKKHDDPLVMMEDLRLGLQYLDNEEENLLMLKTHLTKIKKIREEQIRKDSIVEVLQERVAALERDISTVTRQSTEIQEILTERISFLENAVKDKDELEFKYTELKMSFESLTEKHTSLVAEFKNETERCLEYKAVTNQKDIEISKCKAATNAEKQTISQLQILFETLKSELIHKDDLLSAQSRSHAEHCDQLNQALNIANATIDDLSDQLNASEQAVGRLTAAIAKYESINSTTKRDLTRFDTELKSWKDLYTEQEAVLLKVKGQLLLTQQSHEKEFAMTQKELDFSRSTTARFKQDLNDLHAMISSIAQDMKMIHSLEQQQKLSNRNGNINNSKLHNAQIMAVALSLQKIVGLSNVNSSESGKIKKSSHISGDGEGSGSSSLLIGIQSDISLIVQSICDMIYRMFAQDEQECDLKTEIKYHTESVQSTSAYCTRLEQKNTELEDEIRNYDNAIRQLLEYLNQGRLVVTKANYSPSFGVIDDSSEVNVIDYDEVRTTPTAHSGLKEAIHAINSETRATLLDSVYAAMRTSLHSILISDDEKNKLSKKLQNLKIQHKEEISQLMDEHERQIIALEDEVNELRKQCDDAALAVRFTEYESQQEISRIKNDYERHSREKLRGNNEEVEEMRTLLNNYHSRYTQVTLCLEHALQYITPLQKRLNELQSVYSLSTSLYRQLSFAHCVLLSEIHDVAHSFNDVLDDDTGNVLIHNTSFSGRPESSSRRQRYHHIHANDVKYNNLSPNSKSRLYPKGYHHQHLTLRIITLFILAINRFRRFRIEGKKAEYNTCNLLAVAASITSTNEDYSPTKKNQDVHDFVVFYPAFPLPSMRMLTQESAKDVVEELLSNANCIQRTYFSKYSFSSRSLLNSVKLHGHYYVTNGLNELRDVKKQLEKLASRLQVNRAAVAPEPQESDSSLHFLKRNTSPPSGKKGKISDFTTNASPIVRYRYSEFNDSSIDVVKDSSTLFQESEIDLNLTKNTFHHPPINVNRSRSQSSDSNDNNEHEITALDKASIHNTSSYPVFNDTSSSVMLNDTTSNEMLEIYSDIGKLTGKLKGFNATV